jgi:hypothetical protein
MNVEAMPDDDLDAIERRATAASARPWESLWTTGDLDFIARAREDLPTCSLSSQAPREVAAICDVWPLPDRAWCAGGERVAFAGHE